MARATPIRSPKRARPRRPPAGRETTGRAASRRESDRALISLAEAVTAGLTPQQVLELVVRAAATLTGEATAHLWLVGDDGRELRLAAEHGARPGKTGIPLPRSLKTNEGLAGAVASSREPIVLSSVRLEPRLVNKAWARDQGLVSFAGVPFARADRLLGVLCLFTSRRHRFTRHEVDLLRSFASHAALALENARLFAETRRRQESAETLAAITETLTGSLDLSKVLSLVADAVRQLLGCEGGAIGLVGNDRVIRLGAHVGLGVDSFRGVVIRPGLGATGWVLERGEPLWVPDYLNDPRITPDFADRVRSAGIVAVLGVPVRLGEEVVGVLSALYGRAVQITNDDVARAIDLARVVAIAVANARLYEEARQREAQVRALLEVGRLISATLDPERVLDLIVERVLELMRVRACGIFRLDDDSVLRYVRGAGLSQTFVQTLAVRLGEGTSGRSAAERIPVWTADILTDPGVTLTPAVRTLVGQEGYRGVLSVPILMKGAPFGSLATYWWEPHTPTPSEVETLSSLATLAAVSIENARVFEELTQAYQDLKTAQEQLVRTEKLRALGEMASGVAHDFNNLLAAILGRVQLVQRRVADPTLSRWLEVIEQAALDGARTVRQIQEFARVRRDQPTQTTDVNEVVRDAVEMTRARWQGETQSRGLDIRVVTRLDSVPPVEVHAAELREALTNLILNAVDALPRGGTITLATRTLGDGVEVIVADTGVGMSEAVQRRIFEPFFSTKGSMGTGLGLAMAYGIVSRHGGRIAVESKEGSGSTFTIRLPVGRDQPAAVPPTPPETSLSTIRVLVVDDDPHVRETLADMLRLQHQHVVVADHGVEGIERLRVEPFDLVMTDLGMPGLSGWQVAQAVKALRPDVPVVLVTGWGVEVPADQLRASGVDRVLTKPFSFKDVQEVVAELRNKA